MTLPYIFSSGKNLKLIVVNSQSKNFKNILVSKGVWIGEQVELNTERSNKIIIHQGASLQDRCKLIGNVVVYRNSIFAPNVFISSGTHHAFLRPHLTIREQDVLAEGSLKSPDKLNIVEEDCWIGTNVFIKAGVYIGRGSVIGANSVISKDVLPYSVMVGNSKVLKKRLDFQPKNKIHVNTEEDIPYFYRGFDNHSKFWLPDNLTIFKKSNFTSFALKLSKSSVGALLISTSSGKTAKIELDETRLEYHVSFSSLEGTKMVWPDILKDYESLHFVFDGKSPPAVESMEILE